MYNILVHALNDFAEWKVIFNGQLFVW